MAESIPASQLVTVNPGVLSAAGSPLSLNALWLTQSTFVPINTVMQFFTADAVADFFGPGTPEALNAVVYFNGFENSTIKPGTLNFAQYNTAAVGAYLRGGSLASMTLAQLQAISGSFQVTIDGVVKTAAAVNLSAASSFSAAAAIIATDLGATVTYDSLHSAFVISSSTTGNASTITFATGTIVDQLKITQATGAVTSQGSAIAVPGFYMDQLTALFQNWADFTTVWEPTDADALAFAAWVNGTNDRYAYVLWDSNVNALTPNNPASLGAQIKGAQYDGVVLIWPSLEKAAFFCGTVASINFLETNGRITFAFKGQSGLVPDVTNVDDANGLISNGYNFYGSYATANQQFNLFQPGQIPGKWVWIDPYINQIYMNADFQLAFLTFMTNAKSIPYNQDGYTALRQVAADPINSALNFGGIRPGVVLSEAQKAAVNMSAGANIANTIQTQGWYLQIKDATPQIRAQRGSPPMTFWYTDGGSIQKIVMASIDIQ